MFDYLASMQTRRMLSWAQVRSMGLMFRLRGRERRSWGSGPLFRAACLFCVDSDREDSDLQALRPEHALCSLCNGLGSDSRFPSESRVTFMSACRGGVVLASERSGFRRGTMGRAGTCLASPVRVGTAHQKFFSCLLDRILVLRVAVTG